MCYSEVYSGNLSFPIIQVKVNRLLINMFKNMFLLSSTLDLCVKEQKIGVN